MTDRYDLTPAPKLPEPVVGNARLDPEVRAQARRTAGDAAQLAWDACSDPARMLKVLLAEQPDPAILLPVGKLIEVTTKLFGARGRRVDPLIWTQTMHTVVKMIGSSRSFDGAYVVMRHAMTGAGIADTPNEAYDAMSSIVREFYPDAPRMFAPTSQVVSERARLQMEMDNVERRRQFGKLLSNDEEER